MKYTLITLIAILAVTSASFLRSGRQLQEENVDNDIDVGVDVDDINTVVNNVAAAAGINESNIVVLDNVNFGTIVQQLGEFAAIANNAATQLQQAQSEDVNNDINADVDVGDINTVVNNVQAAAGINQSNIVVLDNVNFGTIVQQLGEFAAEVNGNVQEKLSQSNNSNVDNNIDVGVNTGSLNTVVNNAAAAAGINDTNIVVLDGVNFGTIVQQLGEFSAQGNAVQNAMKNIKLGQSESVDNDVDVDVNVDDINTVVNNAQAYGGINESNIVVQKNVNYGTIVQQAGEFSANLAKLVSEAKALNHIQE